MQIKAPAKKVSKLPDGSTAVQYAKHVQFICSLKVGDIVTLDLDFGGKFVGKQLKVLELRVLPPVNCQSGVMIRIEGYEGWIDSDWADVVENPNQLNLFEVKWNVKLM